MRCLYCKMKKKEEKGQGIPKKRKGTHPSGHPPLRGKKSASVSSCVNFTNTGKEEMEKGRREHSFPSSTITLPFWNLTVGRMRRSPQTEKKRDRGIPCPAARRIESLTLFPKKRKSIKRARYRGLKYPISSEEGRRHGFSYRGEEEREFFQQSK